MHVAKRAVQFNWPRRESVQEGPVAPGEREGVRKKVNLGRKLAFFSGLAGDTLLLLSLAGVMQVVPWSRWRTSVPEAMTKVGVAQSNGYSGRCAEASFRGIRGFQILVSWFGAARCPVPGNGSAAARWMAVPERRRLRRTKLGLTMMAFVETG